MREAADLGERRAGRRGAARGRRGRRSPRSAADQALVEDGEPARPRSRRRRSAAGPRPHPSAPRRFYGREPGCLCSGGWRPRCGSAPARSPTRRSIKHWYPRGLPAERAARLLRGALLDGRDRLDLLPRSPTRQTVQGWADRTPAGFVVHIKAFGVMTRHPVPLEQPPARPARRAAGRRARPGRPPLARGARARLLASSCARSSRCARRASSAGSSSSCRPTSCPKPLALRLPRLGARPARRRRDAGRVPPPLLVRRGAAAPRCSASSRSTGCPTSTVDAPAPRRGERARRRSSPRPSPIAYVRFHGRNAATWNRRGGGAAQRFDYLYGRERARRVGRAAARARRRRRAGLRVLQQQQRHRRGRAGTGRSRAAAAGCSTRAGRPGRLSGAAVGRPAASVGGVRVLSVVHGQLVGPELFGEVIRGAGHELVEWEIADGPRPAGRVRRRPRPRRPHERRRGGGAPLARARVRAAPRTGSPSETPLLGICLGAQTLAHAFGAPGRPCPGPPGGLPRGVADRAGRRDPVLGVLPERFEALFANAYAFELPAGAVELASTAAGPQAFRIGERAWGLQFHPEARLAQVLAWWRDGRRPARGRCRSSSAELAAGIEAWHGSGGRSAAPSSTPRAACVREAAGRRGRDGSRAACGRRRQARGSLGGCSLRDHSCQEPR